MIHQLIFAGPKPGLPAEAFQSYWVNFHAVDYAARIPQIRRYLVATRHPVSYPREVPFFEGVAEIWLINDAEQIASLQSPEFLHGAREDEPRWAAFWRTFVQDSDTVVTRDPGPPGPAGLAKFYVFLKRQPGADLAAFRRHLVDVHAPLACALPGLLGHALAFARAGLYGFGEPRFDAIELWSFRSTSALDQALADPGMRDVERDWAACAQESSLFTFAGREHWIIRPGER